MTTPSITVLMSVYNGERYLGQAIESILCQSYDDFEFLIVNDGSTDGTRDVIHSYDDPRIRLIENEANLGLARSLNHGIESARGAYIARQDADDISEPDRLTRQMAFLRRHPDIALLGSWYTVIDPHGRILAHKTLPCADIEIRWVLLFVSSFVHTAVIMPRYILSTVGLYDDSLAYAMDYDLWQRIARYHPVANLNAYLVRYRIHKNAMTTIHGHLLHEADNLSLNGLASSLRWEELTLAERTQRFRNMATLLFSNPPVLPLRALPRTLWSIWRLHRAFCRKHDLPPAEIAKQRRKLLGNVAGQLTLLLIRRAPALYHHTQARHVPTSAADVDPGSHDSG